MGKESTCRRACLIGSRNLKAFRANKVVKLTVFSELFSAALLKAFQFFRFPKGESKLRSKFQSSASSNLHMQTNPRITQVYFFSFSYADSRLSYSTVTPLQYFHLRNLMWKIHSQIFSGKYFAFPFAINV